MLTSTLNILCLSLNFEVICGGTRHIFETIHLKRWRKSKAVNQEVLCENLFWKTSHTLQENICDEDTF